MREIVTPQPLQGRAASAVGSVGEIPPPIGVQRDLDPPYPVGAPRELTTQPRPLRSELATQHLGAPRRKFVVVTNAGIVTVEKSRPLDALSKILVSDAPEPLVNFFKSYGQAEAATMCLAIAVGASESGGGGSKNSISSIEGGPNDGSRLTPGGGVGTPGTPGGHAVFGASGSPRVPPSVIGTPQGAFGAAGGYQPSYGAANLADRARRALEDPRLTGEPRVDEDLNAFGVDAGAGGQFDMGRAIVQPQLHYSGVHRAVYTYAARLLAPTWERPLWVPINVANEHGVGAGT